MANTTHLPPSPPSVPSTRITPKSSAFSLRSTKSTSPSRSKRHGHQHRNRSGASSPKSNISRVTPSPRRNVLASLANVLIRSSSPSSPKPLSSSPEDGPTDDRGIGLPSRVLKFTNLDDVDMAPAHEDGEIHLSPEDLEEAALIVPSASVNFSTDPKRARRDAGPPSVHDQQLFRLYTRHQAPLLLQSSNPFDPVASSEVHQIEESTGDVTPDYPPNVLVVYASSGANPGLSSGEEPSRLSLMNKVHMANYIDVRSTNRSSSSVVEEIRILGEGSDEKSYLIADVALARLARFPALKRLVFRDVCITSSIICNLALHQWNLPDFSFESIILDNCTTDFPHDVTAVPIRTASLSFGNTWSGNDDPTPWLNCVDWNTIRTLEIGSQAVSDKLLPDLIFSNKLVDISELSIVPPLPLRPQWGILMAKLRGLTELRVTSLDDESPVDLPPINPSELPLLTKYEGPISCAASYCFERDIDELSLYGHLFDRAYPPPDLYGVLMSMNLVRLTVLEIRIPMREQTVFSQLKNLPSLMVLKVTFTDESKPGLDKMTSGVFPSVEVGESLCELHINLRLWWRPDPICFFDDGKWGIGSLKTYQNISKITFSCASLFAIKHSESRFMSFMDPSKLEELSLTWTHPDAHVVRVEGSRVSLESILCRF